MGQSRTKNVIKNSTVSFIMQILRNVLRFVGRTVFVYTLGAEYLGVNSLFNEILSVLAFAELGVGNAIIFSLYKPTAENNIDKIKSLMGLYAKTYRGIGLVIGAIGILILPFLKLIVGDVSYVNESLYLIYFLFLLNSVLSYFFAYKRSLIIVYQKNYLVDIYDQIFYALQIVLQIIVLLVFHNFIGYLLIGIICTCLSNVYISSVADKMFPFLRDKDVKKIEKDDLSEIVTNIKSLVIYKIGGTLTDGTDAIFISAMINVVTVGLYSNYKMIINIFQTLGGQVMNAIIASVGNLNASENNEKKEIVFNEMFYLTVWFFGFTSAGLIVYLTKFVQIWFGETLIIDTASVVAAVLYYYISGMHYPCYAYRTTAGLFRFGKYVPIIAAIINTCLNFVLGLKMGLAGILWASIIARTLTYEIIDPFLVYKRVFFKKPTQYFVKYCIYTVFLVIIGLLSAFIVSFMKVNNLLDLIINAVIFSLIFNLLFLISTYKTKVFKSIMQRVVRIIKK